MVLSRGSSHGTRWRGRLLNQVAGDGSSEAGPGEPKLRPGRDDAHGERRDAPLRTGFFLCAAFMLVGMLGYFILHSPFFRIEYVSVEGTERASKENVLRALEFCLGKHALAISRKEVRDVCLQVSPWIKDAIVDRGYPFWKLRVHVEERRPCFYLLTGEECWLVDDEGVLVERLPGKGPGDPDLPFVTLSDGSPADGGPGLAAGANLRGAVAWVKVLSGGIEGWNLSEIHVNPRQGEVSLYLSRVKRDSTAGVEVLLGALDLGATDKLSALVAILEDAAKEDLSLSRIDLRYSGRPTITLRRSRS